MSARRRDVLAEGDVVTVPGRSDYPSVYVVTKLTRTGCLLRDYNDSEQFPVKTNSFRMLQRRQVTICSCAYTYGPTCTNRTNPKHARTTPTLNIASLSLSLSLALAPNPNLSLLNPNLTNANPDQQPQDIELVSGRWVMIDDALEPGMHIQHEAGGRVPVEGGPFTVNFFHPDLPKKFKYILNLRKDEADLRTALVDRLTQKRKDKQ